jgi:hypothetical protein
MAFAVAPGGKDLCMGWQSGMPQTGRMLGTKDAVNKVAWAMTLQGD